MRDIFKVAIVLAATVLVAPAQAADVMQTKARALPVFEVDPAWPKVPPKWKLGDASSIASMRRTMLMFAPPAHFETRPGGAAAPPVMVFDAAGNFVKSWGGTGSGFEWPEREHGIHIDHNGHVWIGGNNCPRAGSRASSRWPTMRCSNSRSTENFCCRSGAAIKAKATPTRSTCIAPPMRGSAPAPMRFSSPTATAIIASSCSIRTPASSSACGARSASRRAASTAAR